jgi:hypothetical protein
MHGSSRADRKENCETGGNQATHSASIQKLPGNLGGEFTASASAETLRRAPFYSIGKSLTKVSK